MLRAAHPGTEDAQKETRAKPTSGLTRRAWEGSPVNSRSCPPLWSPHLPLLILWDVFDMLLMSAGPCVFFHRAEWLGGPGEPIAGVFSLLCGPEPLSHCPGLPSCLSSGPSLQCRMGDNLLIAAPSGCRTIRPTLFCVPTRGCQ